MTLVHVSVDIDALQPQRLRKAFVEAHLSKRVSKVKPDVLSLKVPRWCERFRIVRLRLFQQLTPLIASFLSPDRRSETEASFFLDIEEPVCTEALYTWSHQNAAQSESRLFFLKLRTRYASNNTQTVQRCRYCGHCAYTNGKEKNGTSLSLTERCCRSRKKKRVVYGCCCRLRYTSQLLHTASQL